MNYSYCPKCKDPLLTSYDGMYDQIEVKKCVSKINHKFIYKIFYGNTKNEQHYIYIYIPSKLIDHIIFSINHKNIYFIDSENNGTRMEWFEPDLSDYDALIEKIKLCTLLA